MDIIVLIVLILLSAVISVVEVGFYSVNDTKLRALADTGSKRAEMALHLRTDPQRLLLTILVGDRLVDTATASLATIIALNRFGGQGLEGVLGEAFAVLVGILTFVLLVFADLVPKTLAAKYSVPVVLNMAYPAYAAQQVLTPIMFFVGSEDDQERLPAEGHHGGRLYDPAHLYVLARLQSIPARGERTAVQVEVLTDSLVRGHAG
ncbi:MAG: DUF21 domain-containing protein [Nitrospira sp. NTP1]|nr:DUF21 domain-containing protein [Nitrospira sp. NTP1]